MSDHIKDWDGTKAMTSTQVREMLRTCSIDKHGDNITDLITKSSQYGNAPTPIANQEDLNE